jgi:hypothetical protein
MAKNGKVFRQKANTGTCHLPNSRYIISFETFANLRADLHDKDSVMRFLEP